MYSLGVIFIEIITGEKEYADEKCKRSLFQYANIISKLFFIFLCIIFFHLDVE
jgi:hypothetical protein